MNDLKNKKDGFSLLELMIVAAIVGIIAVVTVPGFFRLNERSLSMEPEVTTSLVASAQTDYRRKYDHPANCTCWCSGTGVGCCDEPGKGCNAILKLDIRQEHWNYTVSGAPNYTIHADRRGSGGDLDCSYSLSYNNETGAFNPADGKPIPSNCP